MYTLAEYRLYTSRKHGARIAHREFLISPEDIKIPEVCPLLGLKLDTELGHSIIPQTATVDRVNNCLGYIPGNVRVISHKANCRKADHTLITTRLEIKELETKLAIIQEDLKFHRRLEKYILGEV